MRLHRKLTSVTCLMAFPVPRSMRTPFVWLKDEVMPSGLQCGGCFTDKEGYTRLDTFELPIASKAHAPPAGPFLAAEHRVLHSSKNHLWKIRRVELRQREKKAFADGRAPAAEFGGRLPGSEMGGLSSGNT